MKTQATSLFPFVPSGTDFKKSIAFFEELGFTKQWSDDNMAGLKFGDAFFILQNINIPVWQENQMLTLVVTSLDDYWTELSEKNLPAKYPGVKIKPPANFPWGRELNIIDPAGVCWHIRE